MRTNLKVILSAVGAVALLASPAMAKSHARASQATPPTVNLPYGVQGSVAPYTPSQAVTVYGPDLPVQPHQYGGTNPDFQLSHE